MRTLIVYFSRTGSVERMAECLGTQLEPFGTVAMARIEPIRQHGYWGWLMRSFLPGWRVPIKPVILKPDHYDLVCIGFPKWTLSCPPLNQYVSSLRLALGQKVGLFMSYGGFDGARYLRNVAKKVAAKGARIAATVLIKRRALRDDSFVEAVEGFRRELLAKF